MSFFFTKIEKINLKPLKRKNPFTFLNFPHFLKDGRNLLRSSMAVQLKGFGTIFLSVGPGKISSKQHQNIEFWKKSSILLRWFPSKGNVYTWVKIYFNGCNDLKNRNFTPFCNLKRYFIVQGLRFDGVYTLSYW